MYFRDYLVNRKLTSYGFPNFCFYIHPKPDVNYLKGKFNVFKTVKRVIDEGTKFPAPFRLQLGE